MAITSNTVANQALALIGNNLGPVLGNAPTFDSSAAGLVLAELYAPAVRTVAKQFGWDFARNIVALTLSGNAGPFEWAYEYLYPSNGVEIWQVLPNIAADVNNPLPVNWSIGNTIVGTTQTKVIWTNQQNAQAWYNNAPTEATWDAGFQEAVVRLLASELAMALYGRPDTAEAYLQSGGSFETIAEGRMG